MKEGDKIKCIVDKAKYIAGGKINYAWEKGDVRTVKKINKELKLVLFEGDNSYWHFIPEWEVVDKDKDWNLAEQQVLISTGDFRGGDIKKCRDLIVREFNNRNLDQYTHIITKYFGDLN